jgi:hypothetical protein
MMATLEGIVEGTQAVFEAKFMLPWSFSETVLSKLLRAVIDPSAAPVRALPR